uniref:Ubiquitin-conjugating enzyme E2 Z n=1 Tax=viral metagenome TaxID=1070528 RepID=A0A6C0BAJ7_9ZZZZ
MSKKDVFISKETITRLLHDVKHIMKNPLIENGIYYAHDDEDMMKGYALIIGPEDTPYFGGNFFFEFHYPRDYPHSPPHVLYCTNGEMIRFNPNLYCNGKVCISVLNTWKGEQWTSCQSISTILLTLCTLLCTDPLLNEPGVSKTHADFANYTKIIEFKTIDIAILKMMKRQHDIYPEKFSTFYPYVKENFEKNKEALRKYIVEKADTVEPVTIKTSFYGMTVPIHYKRLLEDFDKTVIELSE